MNEITVEQQEQIKAETHDLVTRAEGIVIKTEMENTQAATLTATLKGEIKRRKGILAPTKAALDASKAAYNGLVGMMIDPLDEAVKIITTKIGGYVQAENARRAQLQAIEDAKVAELQRKEDERIAKIQAKAEAAGKPIPEIAPKIIPQRTVAQVSAPAGTAYMEYWSAEITSLMDLCKAIVEGKADPMCVMGNMPYLNGMAKLKKVEGSIIPGVIAKKRTGTSQRG